MDHLRRDHSDNKEEYFTSELLATVLGPSSKVPRDCPFCPTAFSTVAELQRHIVYHLERLAIFALPPQDDDGDEAVQNSERLSDSHIVCRRGRAGSIQHDFGDEESIMAFEALVLDRDTLVATGPQWAMDEIQSATALQLSFDDGLNRWLALQDDAGDPDIEPEYPSEWKEEYVQGPAPIEVDDTGAVTKYAPAATKQKNSGATLPEYTFRGFSPVADVTYPGYMAPVEKHFPYLAYRPMNENFRYTPGQSFERAGTNSEAQPSVRSPLKVNNPPSEQPSEGKKKGRISRFFDRVTGRTTRKSYET